MPRVRAFVNSRQCFQGQWLNQSVYVDEDTGLIIQRPADMPADFVDLKDNILAPAYVELQTNGCLGIHFTNFEDSYSYLENLRKVSRHLVKQGVGAFYVTLPTVHGNVYRKVPSSPLHLSLRQPRQLLVHFLPPSQPPSFIRQPFQDP